MSDSKNILWTGGWDSTYRVIQLYRLGAKIQPIYVLDNNRISFKKELEVITNLSNEIPASFNQSKGEILPLTIINKKDIPSSLFIKSVYKILRHKKKIGKQYYWLACLAKKYPYKNLEVSFHEEDLSKFFTKKQLIKTEEDSFGVNWQINPKKVGFLRRHLFSNMTFPLIEITKPQMKDVSEKNNFLNLMELTWFCHKSNDKPCGKCAPCKQYIRDGFGYRLKS